MNQKLAKLPIKLLTIATPILLIVSLCSSVRADYQVMSAIIYGNINKSMNDRNIQNRNSDNDDSDRTPPVRIGKKNQTNRWSASKTTFTPDPQITSQLRNSFIGGMSSPLGKKYISFLLTPENGQKIFKSFHPEVGLKLNDMADVFTLASLNAFMTIEDRKTVSTKQVQGVREKFRKIFANNSLDSATIQRTTQGVMYWTMLMIADLSQSGSEGRTMSDIKTDASKMMTTIGLNPEKYTLGDSGFVKK